MFIYMYIFVYVYIYKYIVQLSSVFSTLKIATSQKVVEDDCDRANLYIYICIYLHI